MAYNRYDDWDVKLDPLFMRFKCNSCGNFVDVKKSMMFLFDRDTKLRCSCGKTLL